MALTHLLAIANTVVFQRTGNHLTDVEQAILQGAIVDQTYEEIAAASGYSVSYIKRDVGPRLWKRLGEALGETVSKTNFRVALERWQRQQDEKARLGGWTSEVQIQCPENSLTCTGDRKQCLLSPEIYVERTPIESVCYDILLQPGSLLRIKAPSLMGKTFLIAKVLAQVTTIGYRAVNLSLRLADRSTHFTNINKFMRWFCINLSRELGVPNRLDEYWDEEQFGAKISCTTYLEEYLLPQADTPLILCLDDVDLLFPYPEIYEDFFSLLRSWHEKAKSRPLWKQLRLVLAHATDVYIRLHINQSPFNVGVPIELAEFTEEQAQEFARQYGLEYQSEFIASLMAMVGGHPYLLEQAFTHLKNYPDRSLEKLLAEAPTEVGIYAHHLREHWLTLQAHPPLLKAMQQLIQSAMPVQIEPMTAYQLQRMGLVKFCGNQTTLRCNLYRQYFAKYGLQTSPIVN